MSKILLINPSYSATYGKSKVAITSHILPTLGLATIAGEALRRGHSVRILDLSYRPYDPRVVEEEIRREKPEVVGITATTPLMNQLRDISVICKDISKNILVAGGGAHISALPEESMRESVLDVAVPGEGDFAFGDVCDGRPPEKIAGIWHRRDGDVRFTGERPVAAELDNLAFPAWHLYDPEEYRHRMSRLLARRPPVTMAEFSRGCVYKCDFCASKTTMAFGYRKKSPERCAEEVKLLHKLGWREFMLADDIFTTDAAWVRNVCEEIRKAKTDVVWSCTNGIRVESADEDLFRVMRAAGCYRVNFGFESGNDEVLKAFGKGGRASIEQGRRAAKLARAAGMDAGGYFLLGLSSDTEETMRETVDMARTVELDMLKFGITVPFPGTAMFHDYVRRGLIRSFNWDDYHIYTSRPLFAHPRLDFQTVQRHLGRAYWRCIQANPRFILRRMWRGLRTGEFLLDAYYFVRFLLAAATNRENPAAYYAPDRWPRWDFHTRPLPGRAYQKARSNPAEVLPTDLPAPA
jgi:anaerobic magnesium-protoporphyrin IX monomethyl ester cyclase